MRIALLSVENLSGLCAHWPGDPASDTAVAELLRAELSARGSCSRAVLLRRVSSAVTALTGANAETRTADVCEQLQYDGEITVAAGGIAYSTPLRVIDLGDNTYRVVCSLPTPRLLEYLPGVSCDGLRRIARVASGAAAEFGARLASAGGALLSAASWSGLVLAPVADESWLASLDRRLEWQPEPAASLERDGPLEWQAWIAAGEASRWRRQSDDTARLWRARAGYGRWLWAWSSSGQSPSLAPFMSLTTDEGARTVFAVARGIVGQVSRFGTTAELSLSAWLPRAEYRYLSITSTAYRRDGGVSRWTVPQDRLEEVSQTLSRRLGLEFREDETA
jgi:hypothetical protein